MIKMYWTDLSMTAWEQVFQLLKLCCALLQNAETETETQLVTYKQKFGITFRHDY